MALIEILDLYKNKEKYKAKKLSITRALAYYCKTKEIEDLIEYEDITNIMIIYSKYLKDIKNLKQNNNNDISDSLADDFNQLLDINDDSIYNND